ncbi:MAG TPA: glycosyltransferase family 2 protein [Candidatus Kapabacteria bacterium]|nr:glycosyltransferase family 2 protein [Candidatus Kapabacteria bacterium]
MTISGFTFVRNAVMYDFPLRESLLSLLPLCDEVVIALGRGDDGTPGVIASLNDPKIRVIETVWDESLRQGGRVYAQQTDVALAACTGAWCIYLQADEVLHEEDHELILREIERANGDPNVEALLFRYLHFYGSYNHVGAGRQWYRREVRAIRNSGDVISWRDAQGFRKHVPGGEAVRLRARQTEARVFHYGWVKEPAVQQRKQHAAHRFWHSDDWIAENLSNADLFDYASAHDVRPYAGGHPAVMRERIAEARAWTRLFDPGRMKPKPFRMKLSDWIEDRTGWRMGEYRNFVEVP